MDEAKIKQQATNNLTKTLEMFEVVRVAMDRQKKDTHWYLDYGVIKYVNKDFTSLSIL